MRVLCFLLFSAALLHGCSDTAGAEPEAALGRFLDLMDRSRGDAHALSEAYELLDRNSQKELARRARKAQALSGRDFEPWQMLAEGRFRLRFSPSAGGMHTELEGKRRARITLVGEETELQATVPMIQQGGTWRVVLSLPSTDTAGADSAQ